MESETETRKRRVEKALGSAGWLPIVDYVRDQSYEFGAVREYETDSGPADYVLFMDGVAVAIVESKRLELGPQNVLVQAQRYARGLRGTPFNFGGFRVPFVYSTNGEIFGFRICVMLAAGLVRLLVFIRLLPCGSFSSMIWRELRSG